MKLWNAIFTWLILFAAFHTCLSQDKPKAELFRESGKVTSEQLVADIDNFIYRLNQKPNSSAYIIIHNGKVSDNRQRFHYEQIVKGWLKRGRNYQEKQIFIIRAEDKEEVKIQFWLVPKGAEKPSFTEVKWDASLKPNSKPHIFTTTDWSERALNPPPEYLSLNLFSEYLESNPTARGHFVIRERSKEKFSKEQTKITDLLVNKYKINPKRLRFFYIRENKPMLDYYPDVEVWLVPNK